MGAILVRRKSRILPVRIDRLRTPAPGVAQRPFSQAKGDSLAAEFDIDKLGYPVVNRADGIDWVIDGQHRTYALRKQHVIPSDGTIECEVYENLSEQQMADLFPGPEPEPARDRIRALPGRGHRGLRQRTGNHGTNWLIDGQHRMYALRKQAGTKVWHLVVLSRFAGVSGRCLPSGPTPLVHVIEVIWRSSSRAWVAPAMAVVATAAVVVTRRCGFLGSPTTSGWSSKTL